MIKDIIQWQLDRNLHKIPYVHNNEMLNILEEVYESYGLSRREAMKAIPEPKDIILEADVVDTFFDIIVYSIGSILKMGYDPVVVIEEGLKHINTRKGKYIEEEGKFVKEPSDEVYIPEYDRGKK